MATPIPQNRAPFTVDEIAAATGGRVVRSGPPSVGVSTDSRAVTRGSAFVALSGDRFDGHAFLEGALALGAGTAVVSRDDVRLPLAMVRVDDTKRALGAMARAHRERWAAPGTRALVAITGSAGKTTTKTVVAKLLEGLAMGGVHATAGNLNNDVGVPMTLFGLDERHRFAVVEAGTNARGEIQKLASIARPDVGVLTLVAAAHTAGIGSVDDVAIEKGALFEALPESGLAVVNADDAHASRQLARTPARAARTYGFAAHADYRITLRRSRGLAGSRLAIERAGRAVCFDSPLLGDSGALAVAAALAVTEWLARRPVEAAELESALGTLVSGAEGRLSPVLLADGTLLIDDSYNANPASMRASLATAAELAKERSTRLIAVLGEMRELGEVSGEEHESVGRFARELGVAHVLGVGGDAERIVRVASAGPGGASFAADSDLAAEKVVALATAGDVVLVKGSRGVATEKVVRALVLARGVTGSGGAG